VVSQLENTTTGVGTMGGRGARALPGQILGVLSLFWKVAIVFRD